MVGRALEASADEGLKQVLVMVGLQDADIVHALLQQKGEQISGLETRLAQLHEVQSVLHTSLEQCRAAVPDGKCRTMESLNEEACLPVGEPGKKPT